MTMHPFLLEEGLWLGSGQIGFNIAQDKLKFYARWSVAKGSSGLIKCTQVVEMVGGADHVVNTLTLTDITNDGFRVRLENPMIGVVMGKGLIDEKSIAWEFRNTSVGFEGFEIYERDGEKYLMKGEYASDESRTFIEGELWKAEENS